MGGSAFCSRERTAEWPQPARQRPLGGPAIGRFVGSKIPRFCELSMDLLGFVCVCVNFCAVVRDWKGGLLVLCENGAKMAIWAGFNLFLSVLFNWPLWWPHWIEQRPLPCFILAAIDRAEAAAIGRSLRSLFRALGGGNSWGSTVLVEQA